MKFKDSLKLDKFIEIMNGEDYPLFDTSIEKDEITANKSFFIYSKDGEITPAQENHNQFLQKFVLSFVTRNNSQVDVLQLADKLTKARLRFTGSEIDDGKFTDTNEDAKMITLNFVHVIKAGDW
ncbi:hypothetical protein [Companilactobacillus zhongbaensis]|uniref:hypothetical protein n=1 Tax=Companilactobacillus zhongbaensis TaxID=2486009 RepID=UPI000F7A5B79|nr:hypothetical protein [Companilactobacillus zhongbaensis]